MLRDLVGRVNSPGGLTLGRDSRKCLVDVKELGDRSAHNRRYNAVKPDLDKIQIRVLADELINLACLRQSK